MYIINEIINITIGFHRIKDTENFNNERIMGWKLNNMREEWGRTHKGNTRRVDKIEGTVWKEG